MSLFLLAGNPIRCRPRCQGVMHPRPWVSADKRWISNTVPSGIRALHRHWVSQYHWYNVLLKCNQVFRKKRTCTYKTAEPAELNELWCFFSVKAGICVPPGYRSAPLGARWMGTFMPGFTHFPFIVLHVARFLCKTSVCRLAGVKGFVEHSTLQVADRWMRLPRRRRQSFSNHWHIQVDACKSYRTTSLCVEQRSSALPWLAGEEVY